jgi:hypothetical protein
VLHFDEIFGANAPESSREFHKKQLTDTIAEYKDFVVNKAVPKVLEKRKGQITVERVQSGLNPSYVQLVDTGRDIRQTINDWDVGQQYKEHYQNECDINLKKEQVDVALTWPLLD